MDSTRAETSGFIIQTTDILALPDGKVCSIPVSLEFLNGTWSLVPILVSELARTGPLQEYYLLPLAGFSAKVEIRLPNMGKLCNISGGCSQHWAYFVGDEVTNLVLIYLPSESLVLSLSEVAFSEPAKIDGQLHSLRVRVRLRVTVDGVYI